MSGFIDYRQMTRSIAEQPHFCSFCYETHPVGEEIVSHPTTQGVHAFCLAMFQDYIDVSDHSFYPGIECILCREICHVPEELFSEADQRVRAIWQGYLQEGGQANPRRMGDYALASRTVENNPAVFFNIDYSIRSDLPFAFYLMQKNDQIKEEVCRYFQYSNEFAMSYVQKLHKFPTFSRALNLTLCAIELMKHAPEEILNIPPSLQTHAAVALACVQKKPSLYFKLSWETIFNPVIFFFWLKQVIQNFLWGRNSR